MKTAIFFGMLLIQTQIVAAQESEDSVRVLDPYTVQGYLYNRALSEVPAALGVLSDRELERFNNVSILPVINTLPGVRMEERSPGSYRLSIRGSSIRSPFGVRNVKVYWNGLPFTDGGGNTYLNLLDFSAIERIEVIKGPGGSLYGAGTGGVMLLNSSPRKSTGAEISLVSGSYDLRKIQLRSDLVEKNIDGSINYSRTGSDGYRDQSRLLRDAFNLDLNFSLSSQTTLSAKALYTDVFYETPGGLTLDQYNQDPTQARPAAGAFKGAEEQNAHVKNQTFFSGLSAQSEWSKRFSTYAGIYYAKTDFINYAIANFEARDETNFGLRMENIYTFAGDFAKGKISFGIESQFMDSPINVFENNSGVKGFLTITDDVGARQTIIFTQAEVDLPHEFYLTAGVSESWMSFDFTRTFPDMDKQQKQFAGVLSPRLALLKKFGSTSIYASISKGFSPPTLAEVRPSTNVFNSGLAPEKGVNNEVGVRGSFDKFSFDITGYFFALKETIILDRVENGAEYFINAGKTRQLGTEVTLTWSPLEIMNFWGAFAYNDYIFREYGEFSGNELTGVPKTTATLGTDLTFAFGIYGRFVYAHTDRIPLNDANDQYAKKYSLLNLRLGYKKEFSNQFGVDFFLSVDNTLDAKYSLGNDLNARGQRYYNAAPERNYSVGAKFQIHK
jgi:iron complex outermembrane recepter protein